MYLKTSILFIWLCLLYTHTAYAQRPAAQYREGPVINSGLPGSVHSSKTAYQPGKLSSSQVSNRFYELAYDIAGNREVTGPELEQAIIFLTAALELDSQNRKPKALLLELACHDSRRDRSKLVYDLLVDYVDESADLEIAERAISYLLERINSREERERFLDQLGIDLGTKNTILNSRIASMLGMLKAEKTDNKSAEFYFIEAYKANRYNREAFDGLRKVAPEQISPAVSLERLRLAIRENPSDIEVALAFAAYAEKLELYEIAAAGYEYCAQLFRYLYQSEPLLARIYLPWALSCYNTKAGQSKCLHIVRRIRQESGFDLRLEAIAGKAAVRLGDIELTKEIFDNAETKAKQILDSLASAPERTDTEISSDINSRQTFLEQFAWFYCLALPRPEKAVPPANEAWSNDPNSPTARSLLAYALALNGDTEFASPLVRSNMSENNQIAELALAIILISESKTQQAIDTLKSCISKDPGSFAAEQAKQLLIEQGSKYVPPVDPGSVLNSLQNAFGNTLAPVFLPPDKIISAQLDLQGGTFPFGTEFSGVVKIKNNSAEPFIISDRGLFKGNIRIDAEITGDLNKKIPNLIFTRNRSTFILDSGRNAIIPVDLMTGELSDALLGYPQANVDIEFILYLDPVVNRQGTVTNRLTYIDPVRTRIRRPGLRLTDKYLPERVKSISTAEAPENIRTARLFASLLKERQEYLKGNIPYRFMSGDWVTALLTDALIKDRGLLRNPAENSWVVKVNTMAEIRSLSLDFKLTSAVAENLNDTKWPVRLMALYLLAGNSENGFSKVLLSVGEKDLNKTVRDMAMSLLKSQAPGRRAQR